MQPTPTRYFFHVRTNVCPLEAFSVWVLFLCSFCSTSFFVFHFKSLLIIIKCFGTTIIYQTKFTFVLWNFLIYIDMLLFVCKRQQPKSFWTDYKSWSLACCGNLTFRMRLVFFPHLNIKTNLLSERFFFVCLFCIYIQSILIILFIIYVSVYWPEYDCQLHNTSRFSRKRRDT